MPNASKADESGRERTGPTAADLDEDWGPVPPQEQRPESDASKVARRSGSTSSEDLRLRDKMLWVWPLFLIGAMALLGHTLGPFGVLLGGVGTIGVLVLFVGSGFVRRPAQLAICAGACALLTVVYFAYVNGFPGTRMGPEPPKVTTADGRQLSVTELRGGDARGAVLTGSRLDGLDLSRAELDGITAPGVPMKGAILDGAHLAGADLHGGDLQDARLHRADLRGANLTGTNLSRADLTDACLRGANLTGATLDGADFRGASVTDATVSPAARSAARNWPASDLPC